MNRKKRRALIEAADLLRLDDHASRDEIKKAYRRLCKQHHPDTATAENTNHDMIYRLTGAYEFLMRYCDEFKFPLRPDKNCIDDEKDWWFDRFGQDPLWGKKSSR